MGAAFSLVSPALLAITLLATACGSGHGNAGNGDGSGGPGDSGASLDASDSGADQSAPVLGQPITAPTGQWTWVPFDNAFCGNGATTGIGVNLSSTSTRVLIYMEAGGACWSDLTCYSLMNASYFTSGYTEADFINESTDATDETFFAQPGGFFDRTAATNPFKDYSFVYVPYCTGDLHAGDNIYAYPSGTGHHVGFTNMTAYLERIVPTFPSADRVIVGGEFGPVFNWWQIQEYFGGVRVDVIDDSGVLMPPDIEADGFGESQLRAQWNLAATLPSGCTACTMRLDALLGFYAQSFPTHRAALLSYVQDSVLPSFYGITTAQFSQGLAEEISTYFTPNPSFQYFTNPGSGNALWSDPTLATGSVTVQQFVTEMVTDDPTWSSVH